MPRSVALPNSEHLASVGFVILFPGFVIYHYGIRVGLWRDVFWGMFGVVATIMAIVGTVMFLSRLVKGLRPFSVFQVMLMGSLVHMIVWTLVSGVLIQPNDFLGAALIEALATVLIWIAMLFIGLYLTTRPDNLKTLLLLSSWIVLICLGHAFYTFGFPEGPLFVFGGFDGIMQPNYQGVGRSLLVVGLILAFSAKPNTGGSLFILIGLVILMLSIGSRAHLVVVILLAFTHLILLLMVKNTRGLGLVGCFVMLVSAVALVDLVLDTRAAEILDLSSSASWNERMIAFSRSIEVIAEHPVMGSFGYHHWDKAGYAHNLLSAWTQYGLLGFLLFVSISIYALGLSFKGLVLTQGREPCWAVAFYFNCAAMILTIALEPIMMSVFPALAWGLTLRAQLYSAVQKVQ